MKRLARYAFNVLTLLSLLACAATTVLWVGTQLRDFEWRFAFRGHAMRAVASGGTLTVDNQPEVEAWKDQTASTPFLMGLARDHAVRVRGRLDFVDRGTAAGAARADELEEDLRRTIARQQFLAGQPARLGPPPAPATHPLPFALPLALAAASILPATRALRWWRAQARKASGACPTCGYDLRATPTRCPECGTPAIASSARKVPT